MSLPAHATLAVCFKPNILGRRRESAPARMEMRAVLQECDVGHRVVVRRRVGGRAMTDLLGVLVALDADRVVVRAEDGAVHTVPAADVVAGKRVPPRPARYSEIDALERTADRCWPAPVHERLGDWYLRAAQGWTNRANSALPLGDAGRPMAEALEATQAWYARQGLTPRITVPLPLRRDVADALAAAGWYAQPRVLVQTAPLDPMEPASAERGAARTPDRRVPRAGGRPQAEPAPGGDAGPPGHAGGPVRPPVRERGRPAGRHRPGRRRGRAGCTCRWWRWWSRPAAAGWPAT